MQRILVLLLVFSVTVSTAPALADGDFYVIAGGGGVGTKITSLPKTISAPGFYVVGSNLTCPSGNGIIVNSDDVTIDLMGFRLSGNSSNYGITGSTNNVEVRNGTLSGWSHAIDLQGGQNRIINIRTDGGTHGINLGTSGGHVVKGCTVKNHTDTGIFAARSTISNNVVVAAAAGAWYGIAADGIISGNMVNGLHSWGITGTDSASIIGNTVYSGVIGSSYGGIVVSAVTTVQTLVDQNTVYGDGNHYLGGSSSTKWAGKSSFYTYGDNAGAP